MYLAAFKQALDKAIIEITNYYDTLCKQKVEIKLPKQGGKR